MQSLVLIQGHGFSSLWQDTRGQLLLVAIGACALYFGARLGWPDALRWQLLCYLILGLTGLLLILQPPPTRARKARL